jgi:hypothetical protein
VLLASALFLAARFTVALVFALAFRATLLLALAALLLLLALLSALLVLLVLALGVVLVLILVGHCWFLSSVATVSDGTSLTSPIQTWGARVGFRDEAQKRNRVWNNGQLTVVP